MYFWYIILNSERNKLRSLRKYHKKDKKELQFFYRIHNVRCVVQFQLIQVAMFSLESWTSYTQLFAFI